MIRSAPVTSDDNWYWTLVEWGRDIGRWDDWSVRDTAFSPTAFPEPKALARAELERRERLAK